MADDIDELLDEVESKYISSDDRLDVQTTIVSSHDNRSCDNTEGGVEELDAAISSICSIPEPIGVSSVNPSALQIAKENPRKCRVFYVGAPQISTTATVTTNNVTPRKTTQRRPKPGTKVCTKRYFSKPVFELSLKDLEAETVRRKQKEIVEILFEKKLAVVTNKIILDVRKYKRIKSDVWDNFGDVRLLISESEAKKYNIDHHIIHLGEDEMILCKSFVACVKCSAVFSYESHSYGTSTLRAHLKSCGKPRYNMKEKRYQMLRLKRSLADVGSVSSISTAIEPIQPPYNDTKPLYQEHMVKFRDRAGKLQDQCLLFFLSKLKPLSIIENNEFKSVMQTFVQIGAHSGDVDVKHFIPDQSKLESLLQEAYISSEEAVRNEVQGVYGLAFSAEVWVDVTSKNSFITLYCHYANSSGTYKSVAIFTSEFPYEKKSHEDLTFLYNECISFMGLERHRKLFIVDYSYNMVTAVEKNYLFIQCICYSVNRAVQTVINQLSWIENEDDPFALPSFTSLLSQCRNLVVHFKENKLQSNLPKYLVMCSSTCWKSTLEMLQSINNQYDHIMDILQERGEITMFSFDQELLSLVVDFLELYKDGCEELASISSPTLNIVLPWLTKWKRHCDQNVDESPFLATLKSHMSSAIDEEVVARISIFHKLAAMLDPRFKELQFLTPEDRVDARQHAITMLTECKEHVINERVANETIIPSMTTDHFADLYSNLPLESEFESPTAEVDSFLEGNFVMGQHDLDSENKFNPLKYWCRNKERYPYLSRLALWLLSCPASAIRASDSLSHNWIVVFRESDIHSKYIHSCKLVKSFKNM